jgi:hypothetical protein
VAHAGPVRGQVPGKLHREEERPQATPPGSKGNNGNNAGPAKPDKYLAKLEAEYPTKELKARIRAQKMMLQGVTFSQVVEGPTAPPHRVPSHVVPRVVRTALTLDRAILAQVPRVVRTALTPDGAIAILEDTIERLRLPQ